jgi:cytochrome oxidase Cu insertion factor (SCO1/SenC/PrrC family)
MRRVQERTPAGVALISFTVDPERDTPEVLAAYSRRFGAQPERWRFLTGKREALHALSRDAFKLGNVDGSMDHSTRLVLVDGAGRVRGYYSTQEESPVDLLAADVGRLEKSS